MQPTGHLINTKTLDFPRSLGQLRLENPNVSFPLEPTDEDLAPFYHANVFAEPPPKLDEARTQRLKQATKPELIEGQYVLRWIVRPATEEEIQQYDDSHRPAPDWAGFAIAVMLDPVITNWYNALPRILASGLSVTLSDAAKGQTGLFAEIWRRILPSMPPPVVETFTEKARLSHLPDEVVTLLSVPATVSAGPD